MKHSPLSKLQSLLKKKNLDAFFVSAIPTITYLTNFSGFDTEDRNAFLLITSDAAYIFTHGIYTEAAQKYIPNFTLIDIVRNQPMAASLKDLIAKHRIQKLGFEGDDLKYSEYSSLTKKIDPQLFIPADVVTENLRIEKSPKEIEKIAKACALGDKAFAFLLTKIKEGISEKTLAQAYELFVKKIGADISFATIVAFGENGSLPHHIPTDKKLEKNTFIVLDFGVKLDDYCSDMTRTVFFGKANEKQRHMYKTVLTAQTNALAYMKTSWERNTAIKGSEADNIAREYITSQGYPDMPHSLGHGIGLVVHEPPRLSPHSTDVLTNGMVFSIEPGIYLPNDSGIRIEDLAAITDTGLRILTHAPKNLIELS